MRRKKCWVRLKSLTQVQLEEVATSLEIVVPEGKKSKQKATYNAIQRYLCSEDVEDREDDGLEVFQELNGQLKKMLGTVKVEWW